MSASAPAGRPRPTKKRVAPGDDDSADASKRTIASVAEAQAAQKAQAEDELEFEDPYGDEMDDEEEELTKAVVKKKAAAKAKKAAAAPTDDAAMEDDDVEEESDVEEEIIDEAEATRIAEEEQAAADAAAKQAKFVWRPTDAMNEDEQLDYDSTAYHLLHRMRVDWPCLSFDVLPDQLGSFRTKYPHTLYMVAGTQADQASRNKVMILKASDLHKTKHDERDEDDDDDDSDSDEEDLDENPTLEEKCFAHPGAVNRIRVCPQMPHIIATHADTANVHLWNIKPYVQSLDAPAAFSLPARAKPLHSFQFASKQEGYSMAWNPHKAGRLIAGDGLKSIHLWEMRDANGAGWSVDAKPFVGHSSSVEDLVWSPSEENVFASASSDKTIRVWDARTKEKCQAWIAAHKQDVNVIDWNTKVQHLLVSGSDDGSVKIVRTHTHTKHTRTSKRRCPVHKSYMITHGWHSRQDRYFLWCSRLVLFCLFSLHNR